MEHVIAQARKVQAIAVQLDTQAADERDVRRKCIARARGHVARIDRLRRMVDFGAAAGPGSVGGSIGAAQALLREIKLRLRDDMPMLGCEPNYVLREFQWDMFEAVSSLRIPARSRPDARWLDAIDACRQRVADQLAQLEDAEAELD